MTIEIDPGTAGDAPPPQQTDEHTPTGSEMRTTSVGQALAPDLVRGAQHVGGPIEDVGDLQIQSPDVQRYQDFLLRLTTDGEHTPSASELGLPTPQFITGPEGEARGIAHPLGSLSPSDEAAGVAAARRATAPVAGALGAAADVFGSAGSALDHYVSKPWQSILGRMLVASGGRGDEFDHIVQARLAAKGISSPSYFDTANESGSLAGDIWREASANGPAFVGGLAETANPAWWVTGTLGAGVGKTLLGAGVSSRVAGFVESTIANGGLPYADRALNAVFVNGLTRSIARTIGENVPNVTRPLLAFHQDEAGSMNLDRMREILGIGRSEGNPRTLMADLKGIAAENDDASLRENILGPGGGYIRSAGGGDKTGDFAPGTMQGSAIETPALKDFRAKYVTPYTETVRTFEDATKEIDYLEKGARMEWGSLAPEEQLRRLAISDPEGGWEGALRMYRQAAGDPDAQREVIDQARQWGTRLEQERSGNLAPVKDLLLPGDDASDILARVAVLQRVAGNAYQHAKELHLEAASAPKPQAIARTYTYRGKTINGESSTRVFEVSDRQGRIVATVRGEKAAAQRTHDLNVSRAGDVVTEKNAAGQDQVVLPGTPAKEAPTLALQNQAVTEDAARAARGPAGEQLTIDSANAGEAQQRALAAEQGVSPEAVLRGTTTTPEERQAQIAAASKALGDEMAKSAVPASGPRFELRDGKVWDNEARAFEPRADAAIGPSKSHPGELSGKAQGFINYWNGRVEKGTFFGFMHEAPRPGAVVAPDGRVAKEGEKIVPEDAPPSETGGPARPPDEPPLFGERPPSGEEGPNQTVWRVVDQPDGSASLGRVNLENGMTISGERFADRESALRTADARNAEEDALTMSRDSLDQFRNTLEGIPNPLALMSPGQAAATRSTLEAERAAARTAEQARRAETLGRLGTMPVSDFVDAVKTAGLPLVRTAEEQADIDKMFAAAQKARDALRQKLADDPAYGLANPGVGPVNRLPRGNTPFQYPNPNAPALAVHARDSLGTLDMLGQMLEGKSRGDIARGAAKNLLPIFQTTSRLVLTGFDAGSIARQMAILGARSLVSPRRASTFATAAKLVLQSYLDPEAVQMAGLQARARALANGGTALHVRAQGEFGGESVGAKIADVAESVPVIGEGLRRSQVSFNEGLNYFGDTTFSNLVESRAKSGNPMQQAEKDHLAWVLNHQLGYGYDAASLDARGKVLHNTLSFLYAPEWQASRVGVMADFAKAVPRVLTGRADAGDKEAFWNGTLFAASNAALLMGAASALGVSVEPDPHSTNFLRLPLGKPSPQISAIATPLSALGVNVQTYNDTVYLDFSVGLGPDFRLLAQLFPFGGESDDIISGKRVTAGGSVEDPYHPKFGETPFQGVVIDWLTSRGGPGTQITEATVNPQGKAAETPVLQRMMEALVRSYFPMVTQDAAQSSGVFDSLDLEKWRQNLRAPWQPAPTTTPRPTIRPRTSGSPVPAGRPGASPTIRLQSYK